MNNEENLYYKSIRIENKKFIFNLKENHRGKFLKIIEFSGGKSSIIIPLSGIEMFQLALNEIAQKLS
ncbi:MAG: DNA-binding protein [Acidobacteriota bacterium]